MQSLEHQIEVKIFKHLLEIDIFINSSREILGFHFVIFSGLGVQMMPRPPAG